MTLQVFWKPMFIQDLYRWALSKVLCWMIERNRELILGIRLRCGKKENDSLCLNFEIQANTSNFYKDLEFCKFKKPWLLIKKYR